MLFRSDEVSIAVTVIDQPFFLKKINGPEITCASTEVNYSIDGWYKQVDWKVSGDAVISAENGNKVTVKSGDEPFIVQAKAYKTDDVVSDWRYLKVSIMGSPGVADKMNNETVTNNEFVLAERGFIFKTIELADDSIQATEELIATINTEISNINKNSLDQLIAAKNTIEELKSKSNELIQAYIGRIFATFGLALFLIICTMHLLLYYMLHSFNLYPFLQEGDHYGEIMLKEVKAKNENQPYLGLFILLIIGSILWLIFKMNI